MIKYINELLNDFVDTQMDYYIDKPLVNENSVFAYDMHNQYDHEVLLLFPNTNMGEYEMYKFAKMLYQKYGNDENYNYMDNLARESGDEYNRLWIWWR